MSHGLKQSLILQVNPHIIRVYLVILLARAAHITEAVHLMGAEEYAIEGRPYTLICDTKDRPMRMVDFWDNSNDRFISSITVNKGQCTVSLVNHTEICDPNICSCINNGDGLGFEFMWTTVIDSSHPSSTWACLSESGEYSVFTIKIKVPVSSVSIQQLNGFNTLTLEEGGNFILTCVSNPCRPAADIIWYIGGDNYTSYSVNEVVKADERFMTISNLTITPTRHWTGKRIICTGSNIENETIESIQQPLLNVEFGPIIISPHDETVYVEIENSDYNSSDISCTAHCNPTCTIFWITPNGKYTNDPMLSLGQMNRSDSGVYRCVARNALGEDEVHITLTFHYGPTIAFSPPEDIYVNAEGSVLPDITCMTTCKPPCTFIWTKPNGCIINGSMLSLGKLDRYGIGKYKCTAKNSAGEDEKYIQITVNYAPVVNIRAQTVSEGDMDVELVCEANGEPNTYQFGSWVHTYGSTTIRNLLMSQENLIITPGMLKFKKITLEDIGTYSCEVQNGIIGPNDKLVQTGSTFFNVTALPKVLEASKLYIWSENEPFKLAFGIFSNPPVLDMEVRRYFPNIRISNSSLIWITFTKSLVYVSHHGKKVPMPGYTAELNVFNFTSDVGGKYLLNVTNSIGTTVHVFSLVLQHPSTTGIFSKNLLDLVLIVASSVIILYTIVAVICLKIRQARDARRSNVELMTMDTLSLRPQDPVQRVVNNNCYESLDTTRIREPGTDTSIRRPRQPCQDFRSPQDCMSGIYDTIQHEDTCC